MRRSAALLVFLLCSALAAPGVPATRDAGDGQGHYVTDQTGRTVRLPQSVSKVGTPGISLASLLLALTQGRKLTAATPEVRDNPWLRRIFPGLGKLPVPFSRPAGVNLEALLADRPDLVVLWTTYAPLRARLDALGIPVLSLAYATPGELQTAARILGQGLGPEETQRAEIFASYYDANLRRVAKGLEGLPERERPRVYYASIAPLRTEGRGSMVTAWIEAAGGVNVAARAGLSADVQAHLEDVLAWNPQVIITLDAAGRQAILADPRWREVEAVRSGRVLVNPKGVNAWCTRAAEAALQVLWAAKVLHPARFSGLDMGQEVRTFYKLFYGYALTPAETDLILRGLPPA